MDTRAMTTEVPRPARPAGWPSVSVLVPVLNEAAYLPTLVPAMLEQRYEGGVEFLFIDGGSGDASKAVLEAFARDDPRVRVLDNPARFTPHALNVGLRHATGDVIARMDAHTRYPTDYLALGVARLQQGDVVNVGGPAIATGTGPWSRRVALALRSRTGVGGAAFRLRGQAEIEVDSGFCGVWWRETLESVGGWDEEWINDQDFELASRLRAGGGRIVCVPDMAADYLARNSLPALAKQYWRYGNYRVKTANRHPHSLRPSHVVPPALTLTLAAAVVSPRPVRRLARIGTAAYAAALARPAVAAWRTAEGRRDAPYLPVVLSTMHVSYGVGVLAGLARFGVPTAALVTTGRRLLGRSRQQPPFEGAAPGPGGGGEGAGVSPPAPGAGGAA